MLSNRSILAIQYTPAGAAARKAVGGFLRYVQYRDHQNLGEPNTRQGIDGLVRYVAFRDAASPDRRLFERLGIAGDRERKTLVDYVSKSIQSRTRVDERRRAVYRMVLSPEDARGLDLRQLTRSTMEQLEADAGRPLPAWIAAEHRNTAHPHVHIVLPAQCEVGPGRYRTLIITRPRLARMKEAMVAEIQRQRRERMPELGLDERLLKQARGTAQRPRVESERVRGRLSPADPLRWRGRRTQRPLWSKLSRRWRGVLVMAAGDYTYQAELEARQRGGSRTR